MRCQGSEQATCFQRTAPKVSGLIHCLLNFASAAAGYRTISGKRIRALSATPGRPFSSMESELPEHQRSCWTLKK